MTKAEKQAERRRRERKRALAWTVVLLVEAVIAAAPAAVVATVVLPLAYEQRGYMAMGGEWLMIAATFCGAFYAIHQWICDKIYEED